MVSKIESPFQILNHNGFLPTEDPLESLPSKYSELERLLEEMPNGGPGLLAQGLLGDAVINSLPLLDVNEEIDTKIVTALFRDYSFLASAYIWEPYLKTGFPRTVLPRNLAIPLNSLGLKLGISPFLDYAHSYILYNWRKLDQNRETGSPESNHGLELENLKVIRSFTGSKSEEGFILVTGMTNQYSASLVNSCRGILKAVEEKDHVGSKELMSNLLETMKLIYTHIGKMWTQSQHSDFKTFRHFMNGTTNPDFFPNGLLFEGVCDEGRFYRGESAASDSTIPLMDAILEMPPNEVSREMRDFAAYRPVPHQEFLEYVEKKSKSLGAKNFMIETNPLLFLQILDQVRLFRTRHWRFIKMYIFRYDGSAEKGTGGVSLNLLPNVLTVLQEMRKVVSVIALEKFKLTVEEKLIFKNLADVAEKQLAEVEIEMKAYSARSHQE